MPAAIHYSHQILKDLSALRKSDPDSILGPDSKSQISLIYNDQGQPIGAHKIVLSPSIMLMLRNRIFVTSDAGNRECTSRRWMVKVKTCW